MKSELYKMHQVLFRKDQPQKLAEAAAQLGVSRSAIVRWALDEYLQKNLPMNSLDGNISTREAADEKEVLVNGR